MVFDTICAISTAFGKSGIAVIRVSGEKAIKEVNKIFKGCDLTKVKSHTVHYGHIINGNNEVIDEVMVTVLKAPKTFTKEDTVEISTHGGILVSREVLNNLLTLDMRLANPGEFTERAFLNGRIDLVQAEAVMDIIEAKNKQAIKLANLGLQKETTKLVNNLREELINIIASIEVNIDYPEYDDAIVITNEIVKPKVEVLIKKVEELLKGSKKTKLIREGIKTVIIGKPNVGKSSLLNVLLEEDKAIVTDIPGTTRDLVEGYINLGGITLNLIDTAGIRETKDFVEKIGVDKSKKAIDDAELILLILDISNNLSKEDKELLELTKNKTRVVIGNKADLGNKLGLNDIISISSLEKTGIKTLLDAILNVLELSDIESLDLNYLSNTRHIEKMNKARKFLLDSLEGIKEEVPIDMVLIDLTSAWKEMGEITGAEYQSELLSELFSKFCLGK